MLTGNQLLLLGGGALALLGLAARRGGASSSPGSGGKLFHAERLNGLDSRLVALAWWWDERGPHPITIPADGGLRTDGAVQLALYESGASKARTLAETAHGRGCGLDAWPVELATSSSGRVYVARVVFDDTRKMALWGAEARRRGLVWGGDWRSFKDEAHVETPDWRSAPVQFA